ncbi:MAG: helix-turn-helix domain-containing protein [Planctomycetes bacterium]|nr:helix-turn-helix domain-containing protein [Planctomycetota bacterium]
MSYPHTYIKLTPEEKKQIETEIQRLTYARQWKKRKPLQALYLSDQHKTYQNIANYLVVSYRMVQKWMSRYRKQGLNGFIK